MDPLKDVFAAQEAAERWGLAESTVRQWANRGRFHGHELRKSGGVWLVTRAGMIRMTGHDELESEELLAKRLRTELKQNKEEKGQ